LTAFGLAGQEAWQSASLEHTLGHAPPAPVLVVLLALAVVLLALAVVPVGAPPAPAPPVPVPLVDPSVLVTTDAQPPNAKDVAKRIKP
jgi:hypothetical protein